jgi:hypothetical protein
MQHIAWGSMPPSVPTKYIILLYRKSACYVTEIAYIYMSVVW